jgi:hypothetical protein
MSPVPIPSNEFVDSLQRVKRKGEIRWRDEEGNFYTWDPLHGEFEVFNSRGRHLGVLSPDGKWTKPAVRGRKIDV